MEKLFRHKKMLIFVIAIITTLSISLNVSYGSFELDGNNFKWIIVTAVMYILIDKALEKGSKRLFVCASLFGIVTSCCAIIGYTAENYLVDNILISKKEILMLVCKLEAYFVCITSIVCIIMRNLPTVMEKMKQKKENKLFTCNKKSILVVAIILFIAYLPYLLYYYPGNVLIDSTVQIMQGMGDLELTSHHPPIHTAIITLCVKIGHALTGSYNFGAFIYTIMQTLVTCFLFSFTIYYMARKKVPVNVRIFSVLFYALCPTISFLTITMYKDVPFALSMLILTICMTEIATNLDNFMKNKIRIILTIIAVFLVAIFRNNGLYALILTLPFLVVAVKKYKIKVVTIFLVGIGICLVITGPIYNLCNIEKGSSREAFSVILQQFARVIKYKNDELSEEKEIIHKYLPVDNIDELYNPVFADPVKSQFSDQAYKEDKITLIKTYIQLAVKYPAHTIASFLCNSFGYYYPNTLGWGVYTGVNSEDFANNGVDYGIKEEPLVELPVLDKINEFVNTRNIPIISMFLSIGFLFWILVFGIIYCIYVKKYNYLIIYVPIVCMWLTILASPVFGEPRYVYSLFTCLPLLLGITLSEKID